MRREKGSSGITYVKHGNARLQHSAICKPDSSHLKQKKVFLITITCQVCCNTALPKTKPSPGRDYTPWAQQGRRAEAARSEVHYLIEGNRSDLRRVPSPR